MGFRKEAFDKAVWLLEKCEKPHGFDAAWPGYDAIWARDSMIMSLGAGMLGDKFRKAIARSIETLARHQSPNGQIPNAVDIWSERKPHVDFQSVDSTLWFLIGLKIYEKRFGEKLSVKYEKEIEKAWTWLACQDTAEVGMLTQQPTSDWQDAFPHRYGFTINSQALYYYALKLYDRRKEAERTRKSVNHDSDKGLWNGQYYYSWRWKNHNKFQEKSNWFDTLGNLLAVVFGLAEDWQAEKILKYIEEKRIDEPFPVRAMEPPLVREGKEWQDYFEDCDARKPYSYLNGGVWTFIGGFYILALVKYGMIDEAEWQLERMSEANMLLGGNFSEWLDGKTGKPSRGGGQGWNAGIQVLSEFTVDKKKFLL